MATRKYKVINISPKLTDEERRELMQRIGPALFSVLDAKEVTEDYRPKKPKETPIEELGDSTAERLAKEFIKEHPNYIVSVMN